MLLYFYRIERQLGSFCFYKFLLSIDTFSNQIHTVYVQHSVTQRAERRMREEIREGRKVKDRKEIGWDHFGENCY
jgi:predicted NAD-dependent protein-ADP-ribosyltransferase YbiA (DUF1768 family)